MGLVTLLIVKHIWRHQYKGHVPELKCSSGDPCRTQTERNRFVAQMYLSLEWQESNNWKSLSCSMMGLWVLSQRIPKRIAATVLVHCGDIRLKKSPAQKHSLPSIHGITHTQKHPSPPHTRIQRENHWNWDKIHYRWLFLGEGTCLLFARFKSLFYYINTFWLKTKELFTLLPGLIVINGKI